MDISISWICQSDFLFLEDPLIPGAKKNPTFQGGGGVSLSFTSYLNLVMENSRSFQILVEVGLILGYHASSENSRLLLPPPSSPSTPTSFRTSQVEAAHYPGNMPRQQIVKRYCSSIPLTNTQKKRQKSKYPCHPSYHNRSASHIATLLAAILGGWDGVLGGVSFHFPCMNYIERV